MEDLNDQDYKDILSGKSMSGYKVIEAPANWKKIELATRHVPKGILKETPSEAYSEGIFCVSDSLNFL